MCHMWLWLWPHGFQSALGAWWRQLCCLNFGRQLTRHKCLGSAQHERGDALAQLVHFFAVALALNGVAKQLTEALLAAQKTGHQEVKQAPQLAQVVFHGRTRQTQAVAGWDVTHRLRRVGDGVFDVLRLVQHQHVPVGGQPQPHRAEHELRIRSVEFLA